MPLHYVSRADAPTEIPKIQRSETIISVVVHGDALYAVFTEKRTGRETRGAA